MTNQFKQRLLFSTLGVLGLIFCIYYSHLPLFKPIFILLNTVVVCLALMEYYQLSVNKGFQPLIISGIVASVAYVIALSFRFYGIPFVGLPSLILLLSLLVFFLLYFNQFPFALGNLAVTVFGVVYLTLPLTCAMRINYFFPPGSSEDGRLWLAYVLIVSKMTDVGAYFCGKAFGKTKLAPAISPKKTVEGSLGGLILALTTSILFSKSVLGILPITLSQSLWVGILISTFAQLGDLTESLLKRDSGVSDSGHLPGLGGILDVVDSLVFSLPFMYLLLQMGWI